MRILVGMSGGVDSTAVCLMLREQGHEVIGLTIRNTDRGLEDGCDEPPYVLEAVRLAAELGIPHHVADEREAFDTDVACPFVNAWLDGLTPNPCIECNPSFKFRILLEWADRLGCDMVATGHYARVISDGGCYYIGQGADRAKDQSYFLWKLDQSQLARIMFPIGGMTKQQVRSLLSDSGMELKSQDRESMEICFIESDYRDYLRERVPDLDKRIGPGKFVDAEGHVIGTHKGYPYYTVGQRKGLEVAFGQPRYVLKTNPARNTVMLGLPGQLETAVMIVDEPCFTGPMPEQDLSVRIRYRSRAIPCHLEQSGDVWLVRFHETASAVTPGQYAVFYSDTRVVGGALILSQRGLNQYIENQ